MKEPIPLRVIVAKPPSGVTMKVQRGKDELLEPTRVSDDSISFEFEVMIDRTGSGLNFLGPFSQGPRMARFVYVNSGEYAGQKHTCWARRAKLSLMSITETQVEQVLANNRLMIEATMPGTGRDGGPTCASVKGLEWTVVRK